MRVDETAATSAVTEPARRGPSRGERLRAHIRICRIDHWFKNVFVLPGVVVAVSIVPHVDTGDLAWRLVVGLVAVCLVASSNYVLNELQDAPFDVHHPLQRNRPVPSGLVNVRVAYASGSR